MAKRVGLEIDLELHPGPNVEDEPQLSGRIAAVLGGERYGMQLGQMSGEDAEVAVKAFMREVKALVRGEDHGLGGPAPDWWPRERELALTIVEEDDANHPDHDEGSACCGAPLTVGGDLDGEGTMYGVCTECGEPADRSAGAEQ